MAGRASFDIRKVSALLETLCSELIAQQSRAVMIDWLRLGEAQRDGLGLHWRMRNIVCGRYLDVQLACVSIEALAWLGGVGSKSAERSTWDDAFDRELNRLTRVIEASLKRPLHEWSAPDTGRQEHPASESGGRRARSSAASRRHQQLGNELAGLCILVVDGEIDSLEVLVHVLEASGARVHSAPDATRARQTIDVQTPNLMISDIAMPGEDGYALMESVRKLSSREKRRIPSIALGSFTQAGDVARARRAGFDTHITKPVQPRALTRAVAQLAMPALVLG